METTANNICTQLGDLIKTTLAPLIPGDYILLDLPYYANTGDILIWQGTEDFLKELAGRCLGRHSKETFDFRPLPKECTILLLGGGNFGDIYRKHQEFRLEVMRLYPENPVIVLPQTIHYDSDIIFAEDVKKMNRHQHLTICARDNLSAELLKQKNFTGHILTLPDMAFCISQDTLRAKMAETTEQRLFLVREDKELKEDTQNFADTSISDWPQIQETSIEAWNYLMMHNASETDPFFLEKFFPRQINAGVAFASSFKEVYSTRLHFAILRLLLGLPVKMVDNSYGKNLGFYNTWLKNSKLASTLDEEEQGIFDFAVLVHKRELEYRQKCEEEYKTHLASLKNKHQELESHHAKFEHKQNARIAYLLAETEKEKQKHRKYKMLFNLTLFTTLLSILTLIIIFLNI